MVGNTGTDSPVYDNELARLLLNSTGEGIYGIDLEGNCTFANPACANLLGYDSVEDLLGQQMHKLIHHTRNNGEPYPVEECRIYQAFRKGKGTHIDEEVMFCANGKPFPAEYWSYPILRDGKPIGCVVTFIDISERRRAEELKSQHAAILTEVARLPEMNPGPVLRLDGDGSIQLANSAARDIFGDDLVGQSWKDIFSSLNEENWGEISHAKDPVRLVGEVGDRHFVFAHRRDFEGDHVFVFGTDITDQKNAEDALRVYSHIVNASTGFVSLIDRNYTYRAVNRSYLHAFGVSQDEIVGRSSADVIGKEVFEITIKPQIDRTLAGERSNFQTWLDIPNLGHRYLDIHYDPFLDADNNISGVLVDARDITDQQEAKNALRKADELVRLLLDSTAEGIYGIDLQGNCTFVNPACAKLLGFDSVDDLLGQQMHNLVHHTRPNGQPYPVDECRIYQAFRKGE